MISFQELQSFALSLPETTEEPHFDRTSFRVKKKIFATYNTADNSANIMLSPLQQDLFCSFNKEAIHPVRNKWGLNGATQFHLEKAPKEMLFDAVKEAYRKAAPAKLAALVK
jgi:predicted DNA-binding protein (MmcQ/YjbR family)